MDEREVREVLRPGAAGFGYTGQGLSVHVLASPGQSTQQAMCGRSGPFSQPHGGAWFELAGCMDCAAAARAQGYTHVAEPDGTVVALDGFRPATR